MLRMMVHTRWLRWASMTAIVALLPGCSLTEDRHFGVSRPSVDSLEVWFVNCYAAPTSVSLYDVTSDEAVWLITDRGQDPEKFPNSLLVGEVAPGFRIAEALQRPPPENEELRLNFGRGEAYSESLTFRVADLPADGSILAFDGQVMTPDEFTGQGCSDE
jgi:hypothetical protein